MVDWKECRITKMLTYGSNPGGVEFELDGRVDFEGDYRGVYGGRRISFTNRPPCNNFRVGDYVEIDLDYTRTQPVNGTLSNTNAIRKVDSSSSTNIITTRGSSSDIVISPGAVNAMRSPRTMEIAREMSRIVDETGKEVEFKIEDANSNLKYSLILRKQN